MHRITTMWMFAWALQFSTPVKSGHMFIYIILYAVFPTDRLYLGGPPMYIWWLFSLIFFFFFLRKWNHLWSINYWKMSPRPTHFVVLWAQELLTLPQTISSVSHTIIYLWRAASISTISCHQLLRDERDFSTIFSNFQTLLAAFFFHNR